MPDSILIASKNYFVRAVVKFASVVVKSDAVKFRTIALQVPVPVIISPTSGEIINASSVTVKWQNQVSSGYQVEFCKSASFPSRSIKKFRTDLYTHECTYEDIAEGTWYVRVAAMKEGGLTDYSEVVSFTVDTPSGVENNYINDRPIKAIEDGQVVIYRNGRRYNLLGTMSMQ
jgi:phosphohistidine swiveling domain-containing protein